MSQGSTPPGANLGTTSQGVGKALVDAQPLERKRSLIAALVCVGVGVWVFRALLGVVLSLVAAADSWVDVLVFGGLIGLLICAVVIGGYFALRDWWPRAHRKIGQVLSWPIRTIARFISCNVIGTRVVIVASGDDEVDLLRNADNGSPLRVPVWRGLGAFRIALTDNPSFADTDVVMMLLVGGWGRDKRDTSWLLGGPNTQLSGSFDFGAASVVAQDGRVRLPVFIHGSMDEPVLLELGRFLLQVRVAHAEVMEKSKKTFGHAIAAQTFVASPVPPPVPSPPTRWDRASAWFRSSERFWNWRSRRSAGLVGATQLDDDDTDEALDLDALSGPTIEEIRGAVDERLEAMLPHIAGAVFARLRVAAVVDARIKAALPQITEAALKGADSALDGAVGNAYIAGAEQIVREFRAGLCDHLVRALEALEAATHGPNPNPSLLALIEGIALDDRLLVPLQRSEVFAGIEALRTRPDIDDADTQAEAGQTATTGG